MKKWWIVCAAIVFGASVVYFPAVAVIAATDDGFPLPVRTALVAVDAFLFGVACLVVFTARGRARLRRGPRKPTDERTVRRLWWFYGVTYTAFLLANIATEYDKRVFALVVLPVFVFIFSIGARLIFRTDSTGRGGATTGEPRIAGPHGGGS